MSIDEQKNELTEIDKLVNENNGIVVTKTKITNRCMEYLATMTTDDGQEITQKGTICKE